MIFNKDMPKWFWWAYTFLSKVTLTPACQKTEKSIFFQAHFAQPMENLNSPLNST